MKQRRLVLGVGLCASLLAAGAAFAQGRLEGRVTGPDELGLGGVGVSIAGTAAATVTDARGEYTLVVAPGSYEVVFSAGDFTRHQRRRDHGRRRDPPGPRARLGPLVRRDHHRLLRLAAGRAHHRGAGRGDRGRRASEIEREAAARPAAQAARVHPRRRGHPERHLRLQLQHPRLQQLAQPPRRDADRRPRSLGAVPRRRRSGRRFLPAGRHRAAPSWCAARRPRSTAPTPRAACST